MLFRRQVRIVYHTVNFGSVFDFMIVDVVDQLLELRPNCKTKLEVFCGAWCLIDWCQRRSHVCIVLLWVRSAGLNCVLEENKQHFRGCPYLFSVLEDFLLACSFQLIFLLLLGLLEWLTQ